MPMKKYKSVFACAAVPTGDGVRATLADPAVPWKAARSTENGFLPAALEVARHRAGHVSVCGVRPLESSTYLTVDPQLLHQVQKPLHRSGCFDTYTYRTGKR